MKYKYKKQEVIDNMLDLISVAVKVYESKFETKISREKVKFLYEFLLDQIANCMCEDVTFNINNFGSFKRVFVKSYKLPHFNGKDNYIPDFYKVVFQPSNEIKRRVKYDLTAKALQTPTENEKF